MRRFLASSIGVTCAAALSLPLALPAPPASATPQVSVAPQVSATPPVAPVTPRSGESASGEPRSAESLPGSTQSIPLALGGGDRAGGPAAPEQGVTRRGVRSFSMVGVVWDDPETELRGRVQVRTRATGTARWSGWQDIETHNQEHAADPESAERASGRVRGSTAPLWVGPSDGVELRVRAEIEHRTGVPGVQTLPSGLRLELVDPGVGAEPPPVGGGSVDASRLGPLTAEAAAASAVNAELAPLGALEIPALSARDAEQQAAAEPGVAARVAPRPAIVTRRGWGADEKLRERQFLYTKRVKVAFVHHTASGNNYSCSQAASVIRSIYRYHVLSTGWRDIGYNFLIDKCGTIYEGRAGGVAKAVMGAHTRGFNANSMGVAVIGSYGTTKPSGAAVTGIAKLTAWKLGLYGAVANGKTYLTSGGGNLYAKGKKVRLNVISGHRDGFATDCPGRSLYNRLGTIRSQAARYQSR
ncbi:peptidoglycan recognition protein family protein [Streptomyces bluensis]|uniref:peptidoglycan recognition protein family protein n=1 Tax=Streptomyces bluensis TaxID=33897 RepID=UPI0033284365